jgi:hypothetical protein
MKRCLLTDLQDYSERKDKEAPITMKSLMTEAASITAEEFLATTSDRPDRPEATVKNFAIAVIQATYNCKKCYPASFPGQEDGCYLRDGMVITEPLMPTVDMDPEDV